MSEGFVTLIRCGEVERRIDQLTLDDFVDQGVHVWNKEGRWDTKETPAWDAFVKGTVSRDFLLLVFFVNQFPQAPEYTIGAVSNFFENSRRYSQLKVDHWYQRHRQQNYRRYQRHRWQICHRYQQHRRQILPPVSLVLLVSTTPVANNGINIRLQIP